MNFSIEIDATNNMIVPQNVAGPISNFNFVRLPNRMQLYKEVIDTNQQLKWEVDKSTICMVPQEA